MNQPTPVLDQIQWRAPGFGPTDEAHWVRNEALPREGEERWTLSIFPVTVQPQNRLWFLFEPEAAVFNGLSEDATLLDLAGVVEVEILQRQVVSPFIYQDRPSPTDRDISWIQVRCLRAVLLWDIPPLR